MITKRKKQQLLLNLKEDSFVILTKKLYRIELIRSALIDRYCFISLRFNLYNHQFNRLDRLSNIVLSLRRLHND